MVEEGAWADDGVRRVVEGVGVGLVGVRRGVSLSPGGFEGRGR